MSDLAAQPGEERFLPLRRGLLAVSVLDDIDLVPTADGIRLDLAGGAGAVNGSEPPLLTWQELTVALGANDAESEIGRLRLRDWLRFRVLFAEQGSIAAWRAEQAAVPVGLPQDHPLHPGPGWIREQVLGGAIDLGIGVRGLIGSDPDYVALLHPRLAIEVGLYTSHWWSALRSRLEKMGDLTVTRLRRDGTGVIAPMGGCDVVTLLGSRSLRTFLASSDGTGLRGLAVPMRTRGWFDLRRIDPAFVAGAAAATDDADRAFSSPLLVTQDEVTVSTRVGDLTTIVLRDPAVTAASWQQ